MLPWRNGEAMANDSSKADKIQASVAAALSRLRGDLSTFAPKAGDVQDIPERREPSFSIPKDQENLTEQGVSPRPVSLPENHLASMVMKIPEMVASPQPQMATFVQPVDWPDANSMTTTSMQPMSEMARHRIQQAHIAEAPMPAPVKVEPVYQSGLRAEPIEMPGFSPEQKMQKEPVFRTESPYSNKYQAPEEGAVETPHPLQGLAMESLPQTEMAASAPKMPKLRYLLILLVLLVSFIGVASFWLSGEEEVPVITAETEEGKLKPDPDQANQVPNQNIEIFDAMRNAQESNQTRTEVIVPPPAIPNAENLASPDVASPVIPSQDSHAATSQIPPSPPPLPVGSVTQPIAETFSQNGASPSPDIAAPSAPQTGETPKTLQQSVAPEISTPATPQPAPPSETLAKQVNTKPATAKPASAKLAAKPTVGRNSIQLGAVKSEDLAAKEWLKLQKANRDILGKLSYRTEKVEKGGNALYRILGGPFADRAAAQQACAKLKGRGADCLVR